MAAHSNLDSTTCLCCPFRALKAAPKRTMDTEASLNRDWTNPKGSREDCGPFARFPNDLYGGWWMGGGG